MRIDLLPDEYKEIASSLQYLIELGYSIEEIRYVLRNLTYK